HKSCTRGLEGEFGDRGVLTEFFPALQLLALKAGIAQLVEHDLAKVGVASSSLVSRSSFSLFFNDFGAIAKRLRSEEHTSELQSRENLVCRLLLEKKKNNIYTQI